MHTCGCILVGTSTDSVDLHGLSCRKTPPLCGTKRARKACDSCVATHRVRLAVLSRGERPLPCIFHPLEDSWLSELVWQRFLKFFSTTAPACLAAIGLATHRAMGRANKPMTEEQLRGWAIESGGVSDGAAGRAPGSSRLTRPAPVGPARPRAWEHRCARAMRALVRIVACCAAMLGAVHGPAFAADSSTSLRTIAGDLPAACVGAESARLRADVRRAASGRAAQDAWRLASAMLCGSGSGAHRLIAMHSPRRIALRVEGSAPTVTTVGPDAAELAGGYAKGRAWGASVEARNADVSIRFMSGETCWAGFVQRFDGSAWLVLDLTGACDGGAAEAVEAWPRAATGLQAARRDRPTSQLTAA